MIDLSVFTPGNLVASMISGIVAGLYLVAIHPPVEFGQRRRSFLFGWFLGFPFSILYAVRIAIAVYRDAVDPDFVSDAPRLVAAWLLALLFAAFVTAGAAVGFRVRRARARRRALSKRADDSARKPLPPA